MAFMDSAHNNVYYISYVYYRLFVCLHVTLGLDKWLPLTPISRDDQVQGEVLVETRLESYGEVSIERAYDYRG